MARRDDVAGAASDLTSGRIPGIALILVVHFRTEFEAGVILHKVAGMPRISVAEKLVIDDRVETRSFARFVDSQEPFRLCVHSSGGFLVGLYDCRVVDSLRRL